MAGRPGPSKDLPLDVALETGSADRLNPQPGHPGHPGPASARGGKNKLKRQRGFLVVWGEIGRLAAPPASTWEGRGQSLRCLPRLLAALGVDFAFANPTLHHEPNRGKGPCLMRLATVAAPRELPCLPAVPQKLQHQARGT